jgi:alkylation response protein AidB-like acyl-CoA dehydrogenase
MNPKLNEPEDGFRFRATLWLEQNAPELGSSSDFTTIGDRSPAEYLKVCRNWQSRLFESGWAGITWPQAVGGQGLSIHEQIAFDEEQQRYGVSTFPLQVGQQLAGPTIVQFGTSNQQDRFIRPTLSGDLAWCQLWSEPGAGSDLAAVESHARPTGDGWILDGQKVWTTFAHHADRGLLLARTDRSAPKHAGLSFFLLNMKSPGVTVRPLRQIDGASEFNEVFFDEVFIPAEDLLGEEGSGWRIILAALDNERVALSPATFGYSRTRFEGLARLARESGESTVFGRRERLASAYIRERVLSFLHDRVRLATIAGASESRGLASISKLAYSQYLKVVGELALEFQGARGTLSHTKSDPDRLWQDHFLWAPALRIGGGSDEIQRNILAERVLGLPREEKSF